MQLQVLGSSSSEFNSTSGNSGFGDGAGYVVSGSTGFAGAIGSYEGDAITSLQFDSEGRLVVGGWSETVVDAAGVPFVARYNSDGSKDTSFGGGTGYAILPMLGSAWWGGEWAQVSALQLDSAGRIVAAGTTTGNGGAEVAIWRLTSDGSLDTSFGGGHGYVFSSDTTGAAGATAGSGGNVEDQGFALQIDSSGRYVVAGNSVDTSSYYELAVWRYNSDGTLDTTFGGGNGYVVSGASERLGAFASDKFHDDGDLLSLQIDSSGRLVAASPYTNASGGLEGGIWRFNSDGSVDATFGGGAGYVLTGTTGAALASGANELDLFESLQIDSSNRLVISGSSVNLAGGTELAIWRFNSDGSIDATFGGGSGFVVSGPSGTAGASGAAESDAGISLQIDSSGRYVIAGNSKNAAGGTETAIWRYNSNGSADTTFGNGTGYAIFGSTGAAGGTAGGEYDWTGMLQIDSSGRYVIGGGSTNTAGGSEAAIWRYLSGGTLDQ